MVVTISVSTLEPLDLSSALDPSVLRVPVLLESSNFFVETEEMFSIVLRVNGAHSNGFDNDLNVDLVRQYEYSVHT